MGLNILLFLLYGNARGWSVSKEKGSDDEEEEEGKQGSRGQRLARRTKRVAVAVVLCGIDFSSNEPLSSRPLRRRRLLASLDELLPSRASKNASVCVLRARAHREMCRRSPKVQKRTRSAGPSDERGKLKMKDAIPTPAQLLGDLRWAPGAHAASDDNQLRARAREGANEVLTWRRMTAKGAAGEGGEDNGRNNLLRDDFFSSRSQQLCFSSSLFLSSASRGKGAPSSRLSLSLSWSERASLPARHGGGRGRE